MDRLRFDRYARGMTAWKTKEQALRDVGLVVAEVAARLRTQTPREAAEYAWRLDHPMSLDELTDYCASLGLCREPD